MIVPWELTATDLKVATDRLTNISVPVHLDFKHGNVFLHPSRLKSHDWKQVNSPALIKRYKLHVFPDSMQWHLQILPEGYARSAPA